MKLTITIFAVLLVSAHLNPQLTRQFTRRDPNKVIEKVKAA